MVPTKQLFFAVVVFILTFIRAWCSGVASKIDYRVKNSDFEVRCWGHTGSLVVKVTCYGNAWTSFPNIKLDQAVAGKIEFNNCTFPETLSFYDTFQSFNLTNYKTIRFARVRSTPQRQNFQKLKISRLEFVKSDVRQLSLNMLYGTLGLKDLLIERNNIDRIPEQFFKGDWAKNIQKIDLNKNKLRKIARNDFAGLTNLKTIDLSNNKIVEIEPHAFDGLVNLKVLNLNDNRLRTLPAGIFNQLRRLKKIYMHKNFFDEFPQDLLTGIQNASLDGFFMNGNIGSLKTLPNGFFKNLTILYVVSLENNHLQSLPVDLFAGTSGLSMLQLGSNELKNIPYRFFSDTRNLLDLDIGNNHLETLPARIFENLNSLEYLDISHNYLTYLKPEMFTGLHFLKELNVSNNNLTGIDEQFFSSLNSAIAIDLSFNRISFETENSHVFNDQTASIFMKESNKTSNDASDIVNNKAPYADMKNIDLRYNNFTELTAEHIRRLKFGGSIDLRHNHISKINLSGLPHQTSVGDEFSTVFKIMKLLLSNNPLNCNCHFINNLHFFNIESYHGDNRKFIKFVINKESGGSLVCASLSELKKKYGAQNIRPNTNCLVKSGKHNDACSNTCVCQDNFEKQVLSVDCSHKNLTKLPAFIENPRKWPINLNMSYNVLLQTPSLNESYLVNITSLDLSNNNIATVALGVFASSLKELKLHNNRISRLDSEVIEFLTKNDRLHSITLHGNRWNCDCTASQFLNFVQNKLTSYKLRKVTCHGTNRKLYKMTLGQLCKPVDTAIISSSLAAIIVFGLIVGILAIILLCYGYQKKIKALFYSHQSCLLLCATNERNKNKKYDPFIDFSVGNKDSQVA